MTRSCMNCGAPMDDGSYCTNCGTRQEPSDTGQVKRGPFRQENTGVFIMLAAFCRFGLYEMLCAVGMKLKGNFLETDTILSVESFTVFLMFVFLYLAFLSLASGSKQPVMNALKTLMAVMPMFFMILLNYRAWMTISYEPIEVFTVSMLILPLLLCSLLFLLLTISIYHAVQNSCAGSAKSLLTNFLYMLTHPFRWILWTVAIGLFTLLDDLVMFIFYLIPDSVNVSFAGSMAIELSQALAWAAASYFLIKRMQKTAEKQSGEQKPGAQGNGTHTAGRFSPVDIIVSAAALVMLILTVVTIPKEEELNDEERVFAGLEELIADAAGMIMIGETETATEESLLAQARMDAYISFAREDEYGLKQQLERYPEDTVIRWLEYKQSDNIEGFENYVLMQNPYDPELKYMLMYAYGELKDREFTKKRKAYRDEILDECIAEGIYALILPPVVKTGEKGERFAEKLEEDCAYVRAGAEALDLLVKIKQEGGLYAGAGSDMVTVANKYPDNKGLQYLAGYLGAETAGDNSYYYSGAIECLNRYIELSEKDKSVSKKDMVDIKLDCADLMIAMEGYQEAIELLEDISPKEAGDLEEGIGLKKLLCYECLDDGEACFDCAEELLDDDIENAAIWFYYGTGALKAGDRDSALEALDNIAEIVVDMDPDPDEQLMAECAFHTLAEFCVLNDNSTWTGYQYGFYSELDEDDKDDLSKFTRHYLDAMQLYFNEYKRPEALDEIAEVLDIEDELVYARYLEGCIYHSDSQYENAIEDLEAALEADPDNCTFMYMLANAYDGAERYEEAYAMSNRVNELLPIQNHEDDWYGVSVHNQNLRNSLQRYLGGDD